MKKIRFTIEDSEKWYEINQEIDLYSEVQAGQVIANIITNNLNLSNISKKPQKVEVLDERGMLLASSSDICVVEKLKFNSIKE